MSISACFTGSILLQAVLVRVRSMYPGSAGLPQIGWFTPVQLVSKKIGRSMSKSQPLGWLVSTPADEKINRLVYDAGCWFEKKFKKGKGIRTIQDMIMEMVFKHYIR